MASRAIINLVKGLAKQKGAQLGALFATRAITTVRRTDLAFGDSCADCAVQGVYLLKLALMLQVNCLR